MGNRSRYVPARRRRASPDLIVVRVTMAVVLVAYTVALLAAVVR